MIEVAGYLLLVAPILLQVGNLGRLVKEIQLRKKQGLTQEQPATKRGTTKTYISRVENNACDIRLSTLMRIIREGSGGNLKLMVTS